MLGFSILIQILIPLSPRMRHTRRDVTTANEILIDSFFYVCLSGKRAARKTFVSTGLTRVGFYYWVFFFSSLLRLGGEMRLRSHPRRAHSHEMKLADCQYSIHQKGEKKKVEENISVVSERDLQIPPL